MGYGTETENALPTTFFKIKGLKKGSDEIYFEGKTKKGDKYEDIGSKPTKLFGHLTSVTTGEFEWDDEKHRTVKLVIDSADDRVILEGGFSNLMINVINTLAGNDEAIDQIELGVYISKSGYASISILINGGDWKSNKWKFDYTKKLKPLIEETKDKKGKVVAVDKTKLVEFLCKEIESKGFQEKIQGNPPKPDASSMKLETAHAKKVEEPEHIIGEDEDSLPF